MSRIPKHLRPTVKRVRSLLEGSPPPPWTLVCNVAVGGLKSVGFAPHSELLLVASHSGRGLFDCSTGSRVARDPDNAYEDSPHTLEAAGIGPLEGRAIKMAGLEGGGLPLTSPQGWLMESLVLDWPETTLLLVEPGSDLYGDMYGKPAVMHKIFVGLELRAWGFSSTGHSLVVATSSDLTIYHIAQT